jgi:uncharacterized membrane protein (UPF0127 family)
MRNMRTGQIKLNGVIWVKHVAVAETTFERMRGLLGTRELRAGHGLLIEACGSVHTVGMRYAIDVIFLDRAWQVRAVKRNVRPGRLLVWGGWSGLRALEVRSGWLPLHEATRGTRVEWREEAPVGSEQ